VKTQLIRLVDVLALGPFMIYVAAQPRLTPNEKFLLALAGIATILYNGANYLRARELGIDESWHVEEMNDAAGL